MRPVPPPTGRLRAGRRFALGGLLLLFGVFLAVSWVAVHQLHGMAVQEAQGRARLVADNMAAQIQHAIQVGVPIEKLVGVQTLFDHRLQTFDDLLAATLRDSTGRVLHERLRASAPAPHLQVSTPVLVSGVPVASVDLWWREPAPRTLLLAWALPLLALLCFTAALASEALRYGLTGQVLRRERLIDACCARIRTGDFAFRPPRLGRREFDTRLPWLSGQLRQVNEQYLRLRRLSESLQRTEPDPDKRQQLEQMLSIAVGADHFMQTQAARLPDPASQPTQRRWRGLLLGLLAWALTLAGTGLRPLPLLALGLGLTLAIAAVAARQRWWLPDAAGRPGLLLGGAFLGPGLGLLALLAWAPQRFEHLGMPGTVLLVLACVGAVALPWLPTPATQTQGHDHKADDAA